MNATPAPPRPVDLSAPLFGLDRRGVAWVEETLAGLTREQKVGQLLCLYLRGDDMARFTSDLDGLGVAPGAVMMLPRSPTAAARDVAALQEWSRIPLLVAGNLESGAVNFLTGVEAFANPMQVAAAGDEAAVDALADHCIRVARSLGMNWAFAPVVDVAVNPANPITNTRSFGADHELVARLGSHYVARLERAGLMTSPKHFPGDGVDDRDQHLVTSSNDLDLDEWTRTFGAVYSAVIAAGARSIMVGHIRQRALSKSVRPDLSDADVRPGSLAAELIGDVLRGRLGFEGLVVSDNTAMAGFTTAGRRDRTLPEMVAAGVDVVLGNVDVAADFAALVQAVDILTDDRLDEAVRRVLATKASLGLHLSPFVAGFGEPAFDHPDDLEARRVLARRSITVTKDAANLLPLRVEERRRVLVVVVGDEPTFYDPSGPFAPHFVAGLRARGCEVEVRRSPLAQSPSAEVDAFDLCIYFANVRFVGNSNSLRVAWAPWQGPDAPRHPSSFPTVLVSIADPYLLQDMAMVRTALNGYTPTSATVDAALEVLFGEVEPRGVSPVDPFVGHWDAAL